MSEEGQAVRDLWETIVKNRIRQEQSRRGKALLSAVNIVVMSYIVTSVKLSL